MWDDVADWYIEASKDTQNKPLLGYLLESILIVLHPFAPFVTETIWQTLSWEPDSILATRHWPKIIKADSDKAQAFSEIQTIVTEARFITKALGAAQATLYYNDVDFLRDNADLIKRLTRLYAVTEVKQGDGLFLTTTKYRCWLDIDTATARNYAEQLKHKQVDQEKFIAQLQSRLANKAYVEQAPKHIVNQTKEQLTEAKSQLAKLSDEIKRFAS